jgi:hypothetical protein
VGSLGNRVLACTYFGLTFVQTTGGPVLAYHLSWHKPATPLLDALQDLHAERRRHRWLSAHVRVHILDRGTQGDPALRWAWSQGIPYLTLSNGYAQWRRFRAPTHHTETGVPIFVRPDVRLADCDAARGRTTAPRVVVFPADPGAGTQDGRALRYRTAAELSDQELPTMDGVYKARWPGNEHPIKALVAVGFGRNLDRTLDPSTSRGHDGQVHRAQQKLRTIEEKIEALKAQPAGEVAKEWKKQWARHAAQTEKLAALQASTERKGARSDRGGEHLCKLLALLLYNALALLLWKSPIEAVRVLTPALVRELVLARSATMTCTPATLTLTLTALPDPTDRAHQNAVGRLLNAARLHASGCRLTLRLRDPPAILQELRIAV